MDQNLGKENVYVTNLSGWLAHDIICMQWEFQQTHMLSVYLNIFLSDSTFVAYVNYKIKKKDWS